MNIKNKKRRKKSNVLKEPLEKRRTYIFVRFLFTYKK